MPGAEGEAMMRFWQTIPTGWRVAIVFFVGLIVLGRLETNNETTGLVTLVVIGGVGYRVWERYRPPKQINTPPPIGSLRLGHDPQGRPVFLSEQQLAAHGLILGATGSGKTTSLLAILCEEIQRGRPVVAIDLKGSQSFADQLAHACQIAGRPFHWWRPEGPMHWNPLGYGDATELKDKLISAETFTEPHYQRAAERYLQTAIQVLIAAAPDRPVSLSAVVGLMDPTNLKALIQHVPKELMARVGPYLTGLSRDQQSAILGLQSRLALLSESQVGSYLQPGNPQLDLYRALGGGNEAILFSLNSSRYGKLSAQLAAMIIQDLITVSGHRLSQYDRPLAIVAIDEFSALDADNLLHLLARAREAGISVLLSTQELADLERLSTGFRDQVLGNTALLLAHRQNVPDSAELIAKMIGTDTIWKQTYQTQSVPHSRLFGNSQGWQGTGLGTAREVEEFRVHPNTIKELWTGQAVLITKLPTSHATQVHIDPWSPNGHAH
jgi:type IV secretory pathway TraG/TraD family ATPase VirD4